MKLIIDIPKKNYQEIKERTIITCGETFAKKLVTYINKGTPLPEGHGRLIDADELIKNWYDEYIKFMTREEMESINGIIENALTIIPADKEANDG